MVGEIEPITLTPYDLVASEGSYVAENELGSSGRSSLFSNWSNWGNGPMNPGGLRKDLEKVLS